MGTVVVSGMLAATLLCIFFIPASFVLVQRLGGEEGQECPGPGCRSGRSRRPSLKELT